MVRRCEDLIEADNVLFKNRKIFPKFVFAPFRLFLDSKLGRLSLQQLECEMDSTGYPDDHNFFELGYCGHTQAAEEIICPILNPGIWEMELIQI